MKVYEKNDLKGALKTFRINYLVIMFLVLYVTDIINKVADITIGQLTTIRAILCFGAVILLARFLTINIVRKYQITNSYKDNLRFNLNLIIIIVAVVAIFYFLFSLNSNIKEIKDSSEYKFAVSILGEESLEEELEDVKKEARNAFIIVWVAILAGSAVAVYSQGKILDKYCKDDIEEVEKEVEQEI